MQSITAGLNKMKVVCCLLMVVTLAPLNSWATAFRNPPDSASALGRDGGKIAQINDPSAVTHNPANITEIAKPAVDGSLIIVHAETEYDAPSGPGATTEDPWKVIPGLHGVLPFKDGEWVAGLAVSSPFGQSTIWEDHSVFRYTAPYYADLKVINLNPTLATELGDRISVGVGVDVFYSELNLRQYIPFSSVVMAPVPDGRARLDGDGTGVGANAGITFRLSEKHRVAVTYRTPVTVEYNGDTQISKIPPPLSPVLSSRSDFESEIDFPGILAVGYGIQLKDNVRVGVDVEWVDFSRFESLPIDVGSNNGSGLFPSSVPEDLEDTWTAGVGGDWQYNEHWMLRGSYKYLESPIPDKTMAPTLPDADRHILAVGLGYGAGSQQIDLAYAYTIFASRNIDNNQNPAFNGDYDLSSQLIALTYGLSF